MKPDWDKLIEEYKGHASVLIADVDCTAGGKELCESVGVQGYPSIKYGDPNSLEDYQGGRDMESLQSFAKESLGPTCGPGNLDLCDDEKKKLVESLMAMPLKDLGKGIEEKEEEMAKADSDQEEMLKGLQARYEAAQKTRDDTKKSIKDSGLGLMKAAAAHRKTAKSEL